MNFASALRALLIVSSLGSSALACAGKTVDPSSTASPEQTESLRNRWNTAAKGIEGTSGSSLDFTWTEKAFPAPTFRGGSPQAYEQFAEILIAFYSTGDNLEYAKSNGLLTQPFSDGLDPSHGGTTYTLKDITTELTTGFTSLVKPETVAKLKTFCPTVGCS